MITFLKILLFNAISVAVGFGFALWLRELCQPSVAEPEEEEFVPSAFGYGAELQEEVSLPPPQESAPAPLDADQQSIDNADDSPLPKGFAIEEIIDNMTASGTSGTDPENAPDLSRTAQAIGSFSENIEEADDEETPDQVQSLEPLPTIDVGEDAATAELDGVSALAVEVLGEAFDFQSILPPREAQTHGGITELGNDAYRTESAFLKDAATVHASATVQLIESRFPEETVETTLIEQNRFTEQVFTADSPPMLKRAGDRH